MISIGVLELKVPRVATHIVESLASTPAKLRRSQCDIGYENRYVTRASICELQWQFSADRAVHCRHDLEHTLSVASTEVVHTVSIARW